MAETGGSSAGIFSCYIDGWNCVMKELDLSGSSETTIEHFEAEVKLLEELPRHPNITVCHKLSWNIDLLEISSSPEERWQA